MSNLVGVDKITLFLPVDEVSFAPDAQLIIENPINGATGEPKFEHPLYHDGERWHKGREAHYRCGDFQFQIESGKGRGGPVALLQFSGGAFKNTNLVPMDKGEATQNARDAADALAELGISFPVDIARLVRLDIARNVELSHPVGAFGPIFQALTPMKSLPKTDYGSTGLLAVNGQREWALYDKGEEMRVKRPKMDAYPVNTLRPEMRLKKGAVIRNALGFQNLAGLESAWDTLHPAYIKSLESDLFRAKMEAKVEASLDFYEHSKFIMDNDSKRKWQAFKNEGMPLVMVHNMGLGLAKNFVETQLGVDQSTPSGKRQIKRMHLELEQAAMAVKLSDSVPDGTPLRALYEELKRSVLK